MSLAAAATESDATNVGEGEPAEAWSLAYVIHVIAAAGGNGEYGAVRWYPGG